MSSANSISKGLFWKLFERFGVQSVQFVLQIVLARILDPDHYGVLSLMIIFTTLANVFIQSGLNTALIQNKDITEKDYSSVFWISISIATVLYVAIFLSSPLIAQFYETPAITQPLRVLALMLFPGALNSVQLAKITREMNFKKVFLSNITAVVVSGVAGIAIAYSGGGLWALVAQSLLNVFITCIVMTFTSRLKLHFYCNFDRVKTLFRFGWKLLVSSLLETLYNDLRSLVVGKKYNSETLGFYDKGKQFPQFIITATTGAIQSVMLPAMSAYQDEKAKIKELMRNSMTISSYIVFPIMTGLAAVATPLVSLVLTDKWLPCVPYLQIYCFSLAFNPVHSCNLQAINAMGRSDLFLILEIIKKSYGIAMLAMAVIFFESPLAIALTGTITTVISCFVNAFPNKKLIGYSYFDQMKDILPSLLLSLAMMATVLAVGNFIVFAPVFELLIQVITGVAVYLVLSVIFKPKPFVILIKSGKKALKI